MSFNTPILFLTFNRLGTTILVFEQIRLQKPKYLFWASDGPRADRPTEADVVEKVKNYIKEHIDWDCELKTLHREQNLGCGQAVSTAITWFFDHVDAGIILEDDCFPLPGFFNFCEEMLIYYKDDTKVAEVCGSNFQAGKFIGDGSYYFSNYGSIWGWATWARAWKGYDFYMNGLDDSFKQGILKQRFKSRGQREHWIEAFERAKSIDTWDFQWVFHFWKNEGICVVPNKNLIKNIGFNKDGTHALGEPEWYKSLTNSDSNSIFPIQHVVKKRISNQADSFQFNKTMKISFISRLKSFIKRRIGSTLKF